MVQVVQVGTASAAPGQRGIGFLEVLELSDGTPVNVPVIVANGRRRGPTLWIECAMHGNEVASVYGLLQTLKEIDPTRLRGTLIAVPVMNIIGYNLHVKNLAPLEATDWWGLFTAFPGNPEGSFTERYAHAIYETIKRSKADYVVDAHGVYASGGGNAVDYVYYNGEAKVADKSRELAKSSGFEVILEVGSSGLLNGALFNAIARDGIPAICSETDKAPKAHQAFTNFLKHLGMIEGKPTLAIQQTLYRDPTPTRRGVSVNRGGLLYPKVEEKDEVSRGQLLAVVSNLFGEEVEKVISPTDGFVILCEGAYPVKPGDTVFQIVKPRR